MPYRNIHELIKFIELYYYAVECCKIMRSDRYQQANTDWLLNK